MARRPAVMYPIAVHLDRRVLRLDRLPGADAVVVVDLVTAARLRTEEHYEEVGSRMALFRLDALARLPSFKLREFVDATRLTRASVTELEDHEMIGLVKHGIHDGRLVVLKQGSGAGQATNKSFEQRRLVGEIDKLTRRRLRHAGRLYRLVADADLKQLSERERFEVVRRDDAREVLDALAREPGSQGELSRLFSRARETLSADWRPPFSQPDGLILVRRTVSLVPFAGDSSPITPAQLRALIERKMLTWIGIRLVDDDGEPVGGAAYELGLTDASVREGSLDKQGCARVDGILPGDCRVGFPELEDDEWHTQGGAAPAGGTTGGDVAVVATGNDHTFVLVYPDYDFDTDLEEDDELDFEATSNDGAVDTPAADADVTASESTDGKDSDHDFEPEAEDDLELEFDSDLEEDLELEFDSGDEESAA